MNNETYNALYQIGGALAIVLFGGFGALRWVGAKVKDGPAVPTKQENTFVTGDTVAMDRLTTAIDELNMTVIGLRQVLDKEIAARTFEEAVQEEIEKRQERDRQRAGG